MLKKTKIKLLNLKELLKDLFYFEINAEPDGFMQIKKRRYEIENSFEFNEELDQEIVDYLDWLDRNEEKLHIACRNYNMSGAGFKMLPYHEFCEHVFNRTLPRVDNKSLKGVFV
jgi:hypothetical protein